MKTFNIEYYDIQYSAERTKNSRSPVPLNFGIYGDREKNAFLQFAKKWKALLVKGAHSSALLKPIFIRMTQKIAYSSTNLHDSVPNFGACLPKIWGIRLVEICGRIGGFT